MAAALSECATLTSALIVGSGPAAAGAALALSRRDDIAITVIDIGVRLDEERQQLVERLASSEPAGWEAVLVERISAQPVRSRSRGVPEKRSYGSDYPFRNVGQLDGLTAPKDATTSLISAAYGGFSNVWGSQVMPFTASAFESWPFDASAMRPHYEAVLDEIPYAAEVDDLARSFPLMHRSDPLPRLSDRSRRVLDSYGRHRAALNAKGITMGKARLAFRAKDCVRCRLCMTGCPYGLIYSAAQTFDTLQRCGRVRMHSGLMAVEIFENEDRAGVVAQEVATGRRHRFEADRVFVACGAMGTTRLVASSLKLFDVDLPVLESQQLVLPMVSLRASHDPRHGPDFTLNQFNMLVAPDGDSVDVAFLHFYTFNTAFTEALPAPLRGNRAERARAPLMRRLSVALGYLPSWRSPRLLARIHPSSRNQGLPNMRIWRDSTPGGRNQMLRLVIARLARVAPLLDLYPVIPMLRLAAGGKSYHWGGSFPHSDRPSVRTSSDRLGRVGPWRRVHVVDGAVLPNIPAMTFTLTVMSNAHRIARETMDLAT